MRLEDPLERALAALVDLPARLGGGPRATPVDAAAIRDVLVLRLDRIGDLLLSLPALHDLRHALPQARIRLAVGRWSEEIARRAPVDEVLLWSAPWAGRRGEGAETWMALARKARALAGTPPDLALDLQADARANLLMRLTGARVRAGYANTGGGAWITHVVPLDETVSWVEQNRRAVETIVGPRMGDGTPPLGDAARGRALLAREGVTARPVVGIHPSGGRTIKQWPVERWREVARRLQADFGAALVITGGAGDAALARELAAALTPAAADLSARLSVAETMDVIAALDLFLSPDTGPMHMACAAGTPSVAVFGPSAAERYFSGALSPRPDRHAVVRRELWCAPCNLIRRPPEECVADVTPECLRIVTVDDVYAEAARLLREGRP